MKRIIILVCVLTLSACAMPTKTKRDISAKRINIERMCSAELNCETYYPAK